MFMVISIIIWSLESYLVNIRTIISNIFEKSKIRENNRHNQYCPGLYRVNIDSTAQKGICGIYVTLLFSERNQEY